MLKFTKSAEKILFTAGRQRRTCCCVLDMSVNDFPQIVLIGQTGPVSYGGLMTSDTTARA